MNLSMACIDRFDNENKLSLLLAGTIFCKNFILKLYTYFYIKFIAKVVNNKTVYLAHCEIFFSRSR